MLDFEFERRRREAAARAQVALAVRSNIIADSYRLATHGIGASRTYSNQMPPEPVDERGARQPYDIDGQAVVVPDLALPPPTADSRLATADEDEPCPT